MKKHCWTQKTQKQNNGRWLQFVEELSIIYKLSNLHWKVVVLIDLMQRGFMSDAYNVTYLDFTDLSKGIKMEIIQTVQNLISFQ